MLTIRRSEDRGHADHGWLDTRHTFSFADYQDPAFMGFRQLRVLNEDRVTPGMGFGTHPHRDMEIVSVVLEGAIEHRDSTGTGAILRPGEVQRMTAGTGIRHSEFNPSRTEPLHFLQIWILPERRGLAPGYEQKLFPEAERRGVLRLVASRDGRDGSLTVHQDVSLFASILEPGQAVTHAFDGGRHGWLQVARGAVLVDGQRLEAGDGAAISAQRSVTIEGAAEAPPGEVLLFDLA